MERMCLWSKGGIETSMTVHSPSYLDTIMSNVNVAAVAALTDVSCVILAEDVVPDPPLLDRARTQGITLLGTGLSVYDCACRLGGLLGETGL